MNFNELVSTTKHLSCFGTSLLAAGNSLAQVRLQFNRWEKAGKIVRVAKGFYSLSDPYINVSPNPFAVSSILRPASYISLQSALGFYGLIPEYVPSIIAITTTRPWEICSPLGRFVYRHVKDPLFWGYEQHTIEDQTFFMATPEKALLDLLYITARSDDPAYIDGLRLQNTDQLSPTTLSQYAERMKSKKVERALNPVLTLLSNNGEGVEL